MILMPGATHVQRYTMQRYHFHHLGARLQGGSGIPTATALEKERELIRRHWPARHGHPRNLVRVAHYEQTGFAWR